MRRRFLICRNKYHFFHNTRQKCVKFFYKIIKEGTLFIFIPRAPKFFDISLISILFNLINKFKIVFCIRS